MNPERWRRVKEILVAVRGLPAGERSARLDEECRDDEALRREVESLLAHDRPTPGLSPPDEREPAAAAGESGEPAAGAGERGALPDRIGPYRVLAKIGAGGMGVVYRARQTEPFVREVAIKVVRGGPDLEGVLARFDAERHAIARMEHPNIARILDAGTDERGRPYFVMELVDGAPITDYAEARRLSIPERLRLFERVCRAVQHAHQRGVIHRDLKPPNVLVSRLGDKNVPKVIDFGIAKAIEEPFSAEAPRTLAGQIMGTPECMSPEQIRGGRDVDTRSDVYSLGVLLYELLVGVPPFDRERLGRADLPQILRILGEEEAPRPSERWRGLPEDARRRAAEARRTDPAAVERELRDDLDWITLRALEKEPERRYSSASEFAADVRRHLEHRPVEAGPPSPTQRLRKFVRRNRAAVVGGSLGLLALLAGIVGTTGQAVRATRERARAERHLEATSRFANRLVLGVNDRIRDLPGSSGAREYLVRTTIDHLDEMAGDPGAVRTLRRSLASGYDQLAHVQLDLGRTEEALASARRAVELEREALARSPDDLETKRELAERHHRLASVLYAMGRTAEALEEHGQAERRLAEVVAGGADPDPVVVRRLAESRSRAGYLLLRLGRVDEALERHELSIASLREALDAHPDDRELRENLARANAYLGEGLAELGRDEEALDRYRSAAAVFEERVGGEGPPPESLDTFPVLLAAIGYQESRLGRHDEAIATLTRSLELRRARAAARPDHAPVRHDLARGHWQLADALGPAGRRAEAISHYDEARAILRGLAGADPGNRRARKDLVSVDLELAALALAGGRTAAVLERLAAAAARNDSLRVGEPDRSDHPWSAARIEVLRARAFETEERWDAARERWVAAGEIVESMRRGGLLTPLIEDDLSGIPDGIARCDSAGARPGPR